MADLGIILASISHHIDPKDVKTLGKELGLKPNEIKKFKKRKKTSPKGKYTTEGTKEMLDAWVKEKTEIQVVGDLREALERAGLRYVIEACLTEEGSAEPPDDANSASETTPLRQKNYPDNNEDLLRKIATTISEPYRDDNKAVKRLGKELGYKAKDVKEYRKANKTSGQADSEGSIEMLQSWSKDIPPERIPIDLRAALIRADLGWVADRFIKVERSTTDGAAPNTVESQGSVIKKSSLSRTLNESIQYSKQRVNVTICSGSDESSVAGLVSYVNQEMKSEVKKVSFKQLPYNVREMNHLSLEVIDVMVLCHSVSNRGFSITDVSNSLYDKFLKKACEKLGKRRVCVIVHDFPPTDIEPEKLKPRVTSMQTTQPMTFKHSNLVMIAGDLSRTQPELSKDQLGQLLTFFEKAAPETGCCTFG